MSAPGISVIICCFNSAKKLPDTLKCLAHQKFLGGVSWEIILVNNASSDNTVEVALNEWKEYPVSVPFRIVEQPLPGLSFAREKGIAESSYDILVFCDDDNHLSENYLSLAFDLMTKNPEISMLGGRVDGKLEDNNFDPRIKPLLPSLAIGAQSKTTGFIDKPIFGAGMVLRRKSYNGLMSKGFKSLLSDRKGRYLSSGGDTELCIALLVCKYRIYYDERLKLEHFMPSGRLDINYINKLWSGGIVSSSILMLYDYFMKVKENRTYRMAYLNMILSYCKDIGYFFPRIFIGKNKFYSVFNLKHSVKRLVFVIGSYSLLKEYYQKVNHFYSSCERV